MKNSTKRNVARWLHIGVGSIIATYIYSPWGELAAFQFFTKAIVIPLTIISGLWLWKGHLLKCSFSKPGNIGLGTILILGFALVTMSFVQKNNPKLTLKINDVKYPGTLYVNFCTHSGEWSANGKYNYKFANPSKGTNTFAITNIPTGTYAVAIFQDNNGNGKLDENLFGAPKEPFAFSNNVVPKFSTPGFDDCKFQLLNEGQVLSINLLNK
jgi:uncharacterized protein (DUF2141 family)